MSNDLKNYVKETLLELHFDSRLKGLIGSRKKTIKLTMNARAKGLVIRWALERDIELSSEIETFAKASYAKYIKQYGSEIAPFALVQLLDMKYNKQHVGRKLNRTTRDSGEKGRSSKRTDDQETFGVV